MEVGALVAVLAGLVVVPAVLDHRLVVGVGDGLFELVAAGEGVAVEVAVAERIVFRVDRVPAAARTLFGGERHEGVAHGRRARLGHLAVIGAEHRAVGEGLRPRRREDHEERVGVRGVEVRGRGHGLGRQRVVDEVVGKPGVRDDRGRGRAVHPGAAEQVLVVLDVRRFLAGIAGDRADLDAVAVLRLDTVPGRAADGVVEGLVVADDRRRGVAVAGAGLETLLPLRTPEHEVDVGPVHHGAAVVDQVVRRARVRRGGGLARAGMDAARPQDLGRGDARGRREPGRIGGGGRRGRVARDRGDSQDQT